MDYKKKRIISLKKRVTALRKMLGVSQTEFGEILGVATATVSRNENKSHIVCPSNEDLIEAIYEILELNLDRNLVADSLVHLGVKGTVVLLCHKGIIKHPKEKITHEVWRSYNKLKDIALL